MLYDDELEARRELARRRLGDADPHCSRCNETDPLAMTTGGVCYECDRIAHGKPWREEQHPAGRANHPATISMPGNEHRITDALKNDWLRDLLRNPDGSPLLRAAACVQSLVDSMRVLLDRTIGWIPAFLYALHHALVDRLGAGWWHTLALPNGAE